MVQGGVVRRFRYASSALLLCALCLVPQISFAAPLEHFVVLAFPNTPVMVEVARCESGLRHYVGDGTVLRGGLGGKMMGLFQLHETYHRAPARAMGLNIDTLAGNLLYAKHLYAQEGLMPWRSSAHCWDTVTQEVVSQTEPTRTLSRTLRFGAKGGDVALLQGALVSAGQLAAGTFSSATFDIPTLVALVRFQCAQGIGCLGDGTRGVGTTNAATREALATHL